MTTTMDTNLYEKRGRVQNQQINTFTKGMNTDTSDMLLSSDQYRYAENVRLVTNTDNNAGELHLIEGTTELESINKEILATNYIRDIIVYIVKDFDSQEIVNEGLETEHVEYNHGSWYVYKKVGNNLPELVFGPCEELLWNVEDKILTIDDIKKSITTVIRYEAPQNIKFYIADSTGKHSIMCLNVANTYASNNFDDVFAYQRTLLPPLQIDISNGSGHIPSGKVLYAYRLYSKNKPATSMSILSSAINLYKNKYSGYNAESQTGRSVLITMPTINSGDLDYIQIYRILYQISGLQPKISLIKDEKISDRFIDAGLDVISDVSMPEFLEAISSQIIPSQIESKGDYLFAANVKYAQDNADNLFTDFDAKSYSSGNYVTDATGTLKTYIFPDNKSLINNIDLNYLRHDSFSEENTPEYTEHAWQLMTFLDQNNQQFECNGYGKCLCWRYVYDNIDIDGSKFPIPSNQTGTIKKSKSTFRCGETYRFGLRLYDIYGRPSSIKWICDIMIPIGANMHLVEAVYENGVETLEAYTLFRNVGIEFFKTPGSDLYWNNVGGWEIVRCERTWQDRKAITQGIIGLPVRSYIVRDGYEEETNYFCPPGVFSTDSMYFWNGHYKAYTDNTITMFSSPEYCYLSQDIEDILNSNSSDLYLTGVYDTYPKTITVGENLGIHNSVADFNWFWKYVKSDQESPYTYPFQYYTDYSSENNSSAFYFPALNNFILWYGDVDRTYLDQGETFVTNKFINYFTPQKTFGIYGETILPVLSYEIQDINFIDSPDPSDFARDELFLYKNSVVSIDNYNFVNWSTPLLMTLDVYGQESILKELMNNITFNFNHEGHTSNEDQNAFYLRISPIGSGGKTIILNTKQKIPVTSTIHQNIINNSSTDSVKCPAIRIMNINKNTIPYNGYNKTSIDNSSYLSFGDYTSVSNGSIQVFSGDTKNRSFTYNALHLWFDSTYRICTKMTTIYAIPVETDIDIQSLYGILYGVDNFWDYNIQDKAGTVGDYTLDKDSYMYNPAYNASPDIISLTSSENDSQKIDSFDTRIHYSCVKTNNEDIDNWLRFLASDYIDVDSRFGEITDLKLFKDKLIFWQENATGILAVNERVVLNDQNDTQVVLGTGGVLERYDYFTTIYGQKKDQHARVLSNDSLYWWDENNKEILLYQLKYDVTPLSTIKNIKNYLNENDPIEVPFLTYDNKYKEVIASVVNKGSIVYNEDIQAFTSVYTFNPLFDAVVNSKLYLTNEDSIYNYNTSTNNVSMLFANKTYPLVDYVVNNQPTYNKTFDILTFGGRFYGGGENEDRSLPYSGSERDLFVGDKYARNTNVLENINLKYKTPLKQESKTTGKDFITNAEYDFRLTVPRAGKEITENGQSVWKVEEYGDRLRGKTMQCEIKSDSNSLDFSLQYITTKFRMSWT